MRLAGWLLLVGLAPQEADKIGKEKAPALLKRVSADAPKHRGAEIAEDTLYNAHMLEFKGDFKGALAKELAVVRGSKDLYVKGSTVVAPLQDRFELLSAHPAEDATLARTFRNPAILVTELGKASGSAAYAGDEAIEGKEYKIMTATADGPLLKEHLRDARAWYEVMLKGFIPKFVAPGTLLQEFDEKASVSTYKVWIGKGDLLLYKIEWKLRAEMPGARKTGAGILEAKTEVRFSNWDGDLPLDLPAGAKTKLGIK